MVADPKENPNQWLFNRAWLIDNCPVLVRGGVGTGGEGLEP